MKHAVRVATQYASDACKLTISSHLFASWHRFRHIGPHFQLVPICMPLDTETPPPAHTF